MAPLSSKHTKEKNNYKKFIFSIIFWILLKKTDMFFIFEVFWLLGDWQDRQGLSADLKIKTSCLSFQVLGI